MTPVVCHEDEHGGHARDSSGHLPPPGRCRVWIPGRPPGHQTKVGECARLEREVPPGAWLVYRPSKSRMDVRVSVYDTVRARVRVIRVFDAASGALLRELPAGS